MIPFLQATTLALLATMPALAQEGDAPEVADDASQMTYEEFVAAFASNLEFETGSVKVASGRATIQVPEGWAFLGPRDARKVVEDLWGNPEDPSTIGFLDPPSDMGRLGSDFGIIISNDESGYIDDEDASGIDYDEMLSGMQESTSADNEAREEAGYGTIELLGWATAPRYDAGEKKLFWAKELRFDGAETTTLNYDVRVLGRRGYLSLMAVAPMAAYDQVDPAMKTILGVTDFTDGNRYSDFDSSIDTVAAVGIGGLIAGKVAAKAGLFALLAKFGKVIAVAVVGVFLALKRFVFGGSSDGDVVEDASAS